VVWTSVILSLQLFIHTKKNTVNNTYDTLVENLLRSPAIMGSHKFTSSNDNIPV
jgi:hypothetical protein